MKAVPHRQRRTLMRRQFNYSKLLPPFCSSAPRRYADKIGHRGGVVEGLVAHHAPPRCTGEEDEDGRLSSDFGVHAVADALCPDGAFIVARKGFSDQPQAAVPTGVGKIRRMNHHKIVEWNYNAPITKPE